MKMQISRPRLESMVLQLGFAIQNGGFLKKVCATWKFVNLQAFKFFAVPPYCKFLIFDFIVIDFFSELKKKLRYRFDAEKVYLSIGGVCRAIPALLSRFWSVSKNLDYVENGMSSPFKRPTAGRFSPDADREILVFNFWAPKVSKSVQNIVVKVAKIYLITFCTQRD